MTSYLPDPGLMQCRPGWYPCGCDGTAHWHPDPEPAVTGYLPGPQLRCSAYWYAQRAGLLTGSPPPDEDDLEFLRELGYQAACRARWEGIPEWRVREGPFTVNMWPEKYFSWAADVMAQAAAEHGDWHLRRPAPPSAAIPRAWPEDSFWSYPAPPGGTMAYADWCQMADETAREESDAAAWGGQRPSASYQDWLAEGLTVEEDRILRGAYGPDEPVPPMRTRVAHCRREPFDVLIDRTTPWGNPYRIGRHGTREQVIAKYEKYLRSRPDLMAALPLLRGMVLGCHCAPQACHGDVLARYADADPPSAVISPGHRPGPCACRVCGGRYCRGCTECNDYAAAADDATWD